MGSPFQHIWDLISQLSRLKVKIIFCLLGDEKNNCLPFPSLDLKYIAFPFEKLKFEHTQSEERARECFRWSPLTSEYEEGNFFPLGDILSGCTPFHLSQKEQHFTTQTIVFRLKRKVLHIKLPF